LIKLSAFLTRRADFTRKQFNDYWLDKHAPLVRSFPEIQANVRKYVQQVASDGLPDGIPVISYDGIGELWFDDLEGALTAMTSENYRTIVAEDESRFLDRSKTRILLTTERLII
jgi:uncharacterized protein (TIGR02118 family)